MADANYILILEMTVNIIPEIMTPEESSRIKQAAFFVAVCYAPWFLKSYVVDKSTRNDLEAFKSSHHIQEEFPELGKALIKSMRRHLWYLTEHLVVLSLADDDVDQCIKVEMLQKLLNIPMPEQFDIGKPKLPEISLTTSLVDLVGSQSWLLIQEAKFDVSDVREWLTTSLEAPSFDVFCCFVRKLVVVNDCAERNIKLIQDFVHGYHDEHMKQNLMLVARNHRKKVDTSMKKSQLKKI